MITKTPPPYEDVYDFVKEIADEHPTEAVGEINHCRFCDKSWAEDKWEDYWIVEVQLQLPGHYFAASGQHHYEDCLWVRANKLIRGIA